MTGSRTYDVIDDRFRRLIHPTAALERLWTGGRWLEGPVHVPAARHLLFSDIPNDRTLRYDEVTGSVTTFEDPAHHANGHTLDRRGRVVTCEHGSRSVTRMDHDGTRTVLADRFDGRRLNSPNDVVVAADDTVWFSDPTYGIDSDYEGWAAESELGASNVYRIDPGDGSVVAAVTDLVKPNGLAFSPDGATLYVADTGWTHVGDVCPPTITAYPIEADGLPGPGEVFATCGTGLFDGFRVDADGNLWVSAGHGVDCYAADGTRLGRIEVPERVANLELGGPRRNRLFICATTSLYAVFVNTRPSS